MRLSLELSPETLASIRADLLEVQRRDLNPLYAMTRLGQSLPDSAVRGLLARQADVGPDTELSDEELVGVIRDSIAREPAPRALQFTVNEDGTPTHSVERLVEDGEAPLVVHIDVPESDGEFIDRLMLTVERTGARQLALTCWLAGEDAHSVSLTLGRHLSGEIQLRVSHPEDGNADHPQLREIAPGWYGIGSKSEDQE